MQRTSRAAMALVWGLVCLIALYGCSGDDNDDGGGSQAQVTNNAINAINRVLDILLGDDAGATRQNTSAATRDNQAQIGAIPRQEPVSVVVDCGTGEVSFTGEATVDDTAAGQSFALEGALTFSNCEGINGNLTVESSGTVSSSQITLTVTLNSTISAEGCDITFNTFTVNTSANSSGTVTAPIVANGSINATCDGESVTCTVTNIDVNDREAFEDSCRSN